MRMFEVKLSGEPPFLCCQHCIDILHEIYTYLEIECVGKEPLTDLPQCYHCGRVKEEVNL